MNKLSPQTILLIIQGFQAVITAAPQAVEVVTKAKEYIATLFSKGLITKETQDAIFMRVDAECALLLAGVVDPALTVEPDPA